MTGPLAATLARVAARERWLALRPDVPDEPGWHRASDLVDGAAALRRLVEHGAQALAEEHPHSPPDVRCTVAAAVLLSDWCWALAALGAGSLAAGRMVPDLSPATLWLQVRAGRVTGAAVTTDRFWCAEADALAQHPRALPCADLDHALRRELGAHLTRLHAALRRGPTPLLRRGHRAMWGAAGDGLATALRLQAGQVERPEELLATAERLLASAPASWGRHGFDRAATGGLTRVRTSCCLWHRLPAAACQTCPRTGVRTPATARSDRLPPRATPA